MDEIRQTQNEVNAILRDGHLFNSSTEVRDNGQVIVYIYWGDWKHNHGRLKHLMFQHGYFYVCGEVTEEDGSDCYSARHTFVKAA